MPVNTDAIGKTLPPTTYAVGREKIREYAQAVGETDPLYLDVEAARAAGYADVVAPPMFCVVYSLQAVWPALFDDEIGIDFARMVHGGQEFRWGELVVAGDEITTVRSSTTSASAAATASTSSRRRRRTSAASRSAPACGRTSCGGG